MPTTWVVANNHLVIVIINHGLITTKNERKTIQLWPTKSYPLNLILVIRLLIQKFVTDEWVGEGK